MGLKNSVLFFFLVYNFMAFIVKNYCRGWRYSEWYAFFATDKRKNYLISWTGSKHAVFHVRRKIKMLKCSAFKTSLMNQLAGSLTNQQQPHYKNLVNVKRGCCSWSFSILMHCHWYWCWLVFLEICPQQPLPPFFFLFPCAFSTILLFSLVPESGGSPVSCC